MSEDPHSRLAMLDDVTSGITGNPFRFKLDTYTHPVDYLENWRENDKVDVEVYIFPPFFEIVDRTCIGI